MAVRLDRSDYEESVVEIKLDDHDNPSEFLVVRHTCPAHEVIERLGNGLDHIMHTIALQDADQYDEGEPFTWQDVRWEHTILLNEDGTTVLPIEGIISVRLGLGNWLGEVGGADPLINTEEN